MATGSGIAPCTSHLLKKKIPLRLLWVAPNIQKTYGSEFVDTVLGAEPGAVVYGMFSSTSPMRGSSILFVVCRDRLRFSRLSSAAACQLFPSAH